MRRDAADPESVVHGEFAKIGDAKCRGRVEVKVSEEVVLGAMVDVWADGVAEIDKIYNAVEKKLAKLAIRP